MESFGTRLQEFRKERNLTQNDIAEQLDVSAQAVSKWENDITQPDLYTLIQLSDIFNVTVDELVGKKKTAPQYVEPVNRKDINQMILRIIVDSTDGDKVRVNLPMAAVKVLVNNDTSKKIFSGNSALEEIDFNQLYSLVEQGIIGELVSIDSKDGDHVTISVE